MTIFNAVASQLDGLAATNSVCVALGATLTFGTNLFLYSEPSTDVTCITIIPYLSSQPNKDKYRQRSNFQVRMKSNNNQKLITVQQKIIENLHMNQLSGKGQITSLNSNPMIVGVLEGGEYKISVSNYEIQNLKQ